MKTSDVMTRAVVTIAPNATIQDAIRLMLGQRISGLPVVDAEGKLIGILTEGDLLRRAETGTEWHRPAWLNFLRGPARVADDFVRSHGRYVDELMTRVIRTVDEEAPLEQVVETMEKQRIKRLPVMKDGRMVGVVSRSDLLRALAAKLAEAPLASPGDDALKTAVEEALRHHTWSGGQVTVVVTDAVVYLEGVIYAEDERMAMRVAAETVPGVREVKDNVVYQSPDTVMVPGL
jgi:CBS domain-containing protein/(2Fe-2S) ferredoxin